MNWARIQIMYLLTLNVTQITKVSCDESSFHKNKLSRLCYMTKGELAY